MADFYKILGISSNCDPKEVKKAYHRLALQWHPDKNPNNMEEATLKFKQIAEAYEILGKPESREVYDNERNVLERNCNNYFSFNFNHNNNNASTSNRNQTHNRFFNFVPPDELIREMENELFEDNFIYDVYPADWFGMSPGMELSMEDFPTWDDFFDDGSFDEYFMMDEFFDLGDVSQSYRSSAGVEGSRRRRKQRSRKKSSDAEGNVRTSVSTKVVNGVKISTEK